ncbi:hypothetical protein AAC387_Pa01g2485 [Persea americana]
MDAAMAEKAPMECLVKAAEDITIRNRELGDCNQRGLKLTKDRDMSSSSQGPASTDGHPGIYFRDSSKEDNRRKSMHCSH